MCEPKPNQTTPGGYIERTDVQKTENPFRNTSTPGEPKYGEGGRITPPRTLLGRPGGRRPSRRWWVPRRRGRRVRDRWEPPLGGARQGPRVQPKALNAPVSFGARGHPSPGRRFTTETSLARPAVCREGERIYPPPGAQAARVMSHLEIRRGDLGTARGSGLPSPQVPWFLAASRA